MRALGREKATAKPRHPFSFGAWTVLLFLALAMPFVMPFAMQSSAWAAHLAISCGSVGTELEVCRSAARAWASKTGNEVEVFPSPSGAGERLGQLQLLLAAKSADIDVFLIDTTWPGILGDFFLNLGSDSRIKAIAADFFPVFIRNNTLKQRLVALPWFIDSPVLYFRKDLLNKYGEKPPTTWSELTRIASKIQKAERKARNPRLWGYVFEGRAYEGLTCNGLEWIHGWGGGEIVDASGKVTVNNGLAARALELAASWVGAISPYGVLNYMEEEARGVFQSGNAVFLRNWPYVWKLANAPGSAVKGKIGMTFLPSGDGKEIHRAGVLGGWSLAVSKYSRNPGEAIDLVRYLTGPEEQKRRTLLLGQSPTLLALYRDPELLAKDPRLPFLKKVFERAILRPSAITGPLYNRMSSEFWDTVHQILSGDQEAPAALQKLQSRLIFISRGEKW